jgi:hypothetical protein
MQYEYDWSGAEREFRRAIQHNLNSAEAHAQYTEYLENVGRTTDSGKEREFAQTLDPAHDYRKCLGPLRCDDTVDQNQGILDLIASGDPFFNWRSGQGLRHCWQVQRIGRHVGTVLEYVWMARFCASA